MGSKQITYQYEYYKFTTNRKEGDEENWSGLELENEITSEESWILEIEQTPLWHRTPMQEIERTIKCENRDRRCHPSE